MMYHPGMHRHHAAILTSVAVAALVAAALWLAPSKRIAPERERHGLPQEPGVRPAK